MGKTKSFWIAVFGIEEESKWLHSEKVNIFISAIIPSFFSLVGIIISYYNTSSNHLNIRAILGNDVFINAMQLVVIICTLLVTYRIRHSLLITKNKADMLKTYIREECNLRDRSPENVESTHNVVKHTVRQFFGFWIAFWATLLLYYSCDLCFSVLKSVHFYPSEFDIHRLSTIENIFYNFFNYVSSTMLLALFITLNSVTVSFNERHTGKYGVVSAVLIMLLFGCLIIYPTLFSSALTGISYVEVNFFTSLVLGIYSSLTFVLLLGKLNTNLQIPRFIFYWLYIYALVQIFQFSFIDISGGGCSFCPNSIEFIGIHLFNGWYLQDSTNHCHNCRLFSDLFAFLDTFKITFQYVTLIGKIFLSLTLVWIAHEYKFIHFVLRQSQSITDLKYMMNVFNTYMRDT